MTELSALLGKSVILLDDCEILGEIADILLDEKCKKIEYFVIKRAPLDLPASLSYSAVAYGDVSSFSDALTLADGAGAIPLADLDLTSYKSSMFEKRVYTRNGAYKGLIREIICGENGKIKFFSTDTAKYKSEDLGGVGEIIILRGEKQPRQHRKMPAATIDAKVTILNADAGETSADAKDSAATGNITTTNADEIKENTETPAEQIKTNKTAGQSAAGNKADAGQTKADNQNSYIVETALWKTGADGANGVEIKDNETAALSMADSMAETAEEQIKANDLSNGQIETKDTVVKATEYPETLNAFIPSDSESANLKSVSDEQPVSLKEIIEMIESASFRSDEDDAHIPARIICDYGFLLNRVLSAGLDAYTGENIAPAGTVITAELVEKARRAGKLVELTLNSRP